MGVIASTTTGINSPRSQFIRIEALVLIGIVVLFLLLVLGSYRRQCSHEAVKIIVWGAYTVSYTWVSYTMGLMQSYHVGSSLFAVWAVCLMLILGNVDSLSAYSLHDNDNWKRIYIQQLVQFFWVGWLVGAYGERDLSIQLWFLIIISMYTTSTLMKSFRSASKSYHLPDHTKWVADYMRYEHELENTVVPNPIHMHGYSYIVTGEHVGTICQPPDYLFRFKPDETKLITVEQIWKCNAKLLHHQYRESSRLKDICLSMALSKMLKRRFAGFDLAESKLQKTHDFVFKGLLYSDNTYERAFRVIEVELGFVHDFFYTKYYVLFASHDERSSAIILPVLSLPFCLWLAYMLFQRFRAPQDEIHHAIKRCHRTPGDADNGRRVHHAPVDSSYACWNTGSRRLSRDTLNSNALRPPTGSPFIREIKIAFDVLYISELPLLVHVFHMYDRYNKLCCGLYFVKDGMYRIYIS